MINLKNIAEGWAKSMGILEVPEADRAISQGRVNVCSTCPHALESRFLRLLRGNVHNFEALHCSVCKCPVNEKSLVKEEYCPLGQWPGDVTNEKFIAHNKKQTNKMKKGFFMSFFAIIMAVTSFAQNDPLSLAQQTKFQSGVIPAYTTGGFKVLVRNNTTKLLEMTSYLVVNDTVNGTFEIIGNGSTGHGFDLATKSYHAYFWAKLNRGGGKSRLTDTSGTYFIESVSDSGIYELLPVSTKNKVFSVSNKPGFTYGIGAKGQGYARLDDSANATKFIEIDPLVGIKSKDTLFSLQTFFSAKTPAGTTAFTADTSQATINSNKLRIGSATAPFIRSGSGTPLFVISAPVGSVYLRTNGVVDSVIYFKAAGTDSAGWYPAKH